MSDTTPPPPPPLPEQPASQAAAGAAAPRQAAPSPGAAAPTPSADGASVRTTAYNPATDPDDTGVPSVVGDASDVGRGFLRALFDVSFRTFITRRLASAF